MTPTASLSVIWTLSLRKITQPQVSGGGGRAIDLRFRLLKINKWRHTENPAKGQILLCLCPTDEQIEHFSLT